MTGGCADDAWRIDPFCLVLTRSGCDSVHSRAMPSDATRSLPVALRLSAPERHFAQLVVLGIPHALAAERAGFGTIDGAEVLRRPAVAAAVRSLQLAAIRGQGVVVATATLIEVCEDKDAPASARVSAARVLYAAAGILQAGKTLAEPPTAGPGAAPDYAMPAADSADTLRQMMAQLAAMKDRLDRAEPIDVTPAASSPIDI